MVKRRDLVKELRDAGFESDHDTKHETFRKPGYVTRVPRHAEIPESTARNIRKQAGLR